MAELFTLQEFYDSYFPDHPSRHGLIPEAGHFNVFKRGQFCKRPTQIQRTDFYKISFVVGSGILHLEDRSMEISVPSVIFYNPSVPHLWEPLSAKQEGYFCLFNHEFIKSALRDSYVRNSPLFNPRLNPVYGLSGQQASDLNFIFRKMMEEMEGNYVYRFEIIHHYIQLLIHEANKTQPVFLTSDKFTNAASRIASQFIDLLERQFPVDSTEHSLKLKSPHEFAEKLAVHVNHLNRAVKEVTASSTSEIISARVTAEAQSLLFHTDNTIAEIAYSLGFEHPSNFNIFFKKQTGKTPKGLRDKIRKKQSIAD